MSSVKPLCKNTELNRCIIIFIIIIIRIVHEIRSEKAGKHGMTIKGITLLHSFNRTDGNYARDEMAMDG